MYLEKQSMSVEQSSTTHLLNALENLELKGRVCYKSEDKITPDSSEKFVRMIMERGHESVLEHESFSARIICSRSTSHQLVRHRLVSYSQESQRYCNYTKDKFGNNVGFIIPVWSELAPAELSQQTIDGLYANEKITRREYFFLSACCDSEKSYRILVTDGLAAEDAREVLVNACKTEIVVSANLRQWRHMFRIRCDRHAQLPIRTCFRSLLAQVNELCPVVFSDLHKRFNSKIPAILA